MQKKFPIILGVILGVTLLLYWLIHIYFVPENEISKTEIAHFVSSFMNLNKIEVQTSGGVRKEDIVICWNGASVYQNGKIIHKGIRESRYSYGENEFVVQVKDQKVGSYLQYKFNNWGFHKYIFAVTKRNGKFHCDLKIIGASDHYDIIDSSQITNAQAQTPVWAASRWEIPKLKSLRNSGRILPKEATVFMIFTMKLPSFHPISFVDNPNFNISAYS